MLSRIRRGMATSAMRGRPPTVLVCSVRYSSTSQPRSDRTLIDLPDDVAEGVSVYRNVITQAQEQKLWEELDPMLEKRGEKAYVMGTGMSREAADVRNVCMDLYGFEDFKEVRLPSKREIQRVPGLKWSPTLLDFAQTLGARLLGDAPDAVRVFEHQMPGYEMHVEPPPLGGSFLVMNLFAPSVSRFDNEAEGKHGQVLLPERCLMRVSGEARWGWRIGESFEDTVRFQKLRKTIESEYRVALWFFKVNPNLADTRAAMNLLQQQTASKDSKAEPSNIEEADVVVLPPTSAQSAPKSPGEIQAEKELQEAARRDQIARERAAEREREKEDQEAFAREALGDNDGPGPLGGELRGGKKKNFKEHKHAQGEQGTRYFDEYKKDLGRMSNVMDEVKKGHEQGKGFDEDHLKQELERAMRLSGTRRDGQTDVMGFNDANPGQAWEDTSNRAEYYRDMMRNMNFDTSTRVDPEPNTTERSVASRTGPAQTPEENLAQMRQARDSFIGDTKVEPFDPKEAARVIEENRQALRRKYGKQ